MSLTASRASVFCAPTTSLPRVARATTPSPSRASSMSLSLAVFKIAAASQASWRRPRFTTELGDTVLTRASTRGSGQRHGEQIFIKTVARLSAGKSLYAFDRNGSDRRFSFENRDHVFAVITCRHHGLPSRFQVSTDTSAAGAS